MSDNPQIERATDRVLGGSITRHSTAEQAAAILRSAILEGRLRPGESLREVQLATELGVSRSSIRESIRILEGEYLVRSQMNRGAVVVELSDEEIDDLFAARQVLELAGLRGLQLMAPKQRVGYLEPFVAEIETANQAGDLPATAAADRAFHTAIVRAAGNAHLNRWYEGLRAELALALVLSEQHRESLGRSATRTSRARNDHRTLARAIGRSQAAGEKALAAHLADGAAELHRLRAHLRT